MQDAYSLRCVPQVHGAVRDAFPYAAGVVAIEMNAATDNPIVLAERGEVLSAATSTASRWHSPSTRSAGAPSWPDLRTPDRPAAEPGHVERPAAFPDRYGGLNSGLMIAQYAAAAWSTRARCAHPASADPIPTSANQEDHVSMGATSAMLLWHVCANVERVLGIELLCGAQGLDYLAPKRPGRAVAAAHAAVREISPHLDADRSLTAEIEMLAGRIRDGSLLTAVERGSAQLH